MIFARAWNPTEREYETGLLIYETGLLIPTTRKPIPPDWIPEYGYRNTCGNVFYHGDILRISWLRENVIIAYRTRSKNTVPYFVFARPASVQSLDPGVYDTDIIAYRDSRIENLGSYRQPRTVYRRPTSKPTPKPKDAIDIYSKIKGINNDG